MPMPRVIGESLGGGRFLVGEVPLKGNSWLNNLICGVGVGRSRGWYVIANKQRQHRTSHAPNDVLP